MKHKPGPVPKEALDFFRAKGFKPGFDYRDVWGQEHATSFTVAKAMEMDILTAIRGSLDNALEMGMTYREFTKQLTPLLQKLGWWGKRLVDDPLTGEAVTAQLGSPHRLKTIYDANLRTARAAGQWERAQRTKKSHPYFVYELGPSEQHRPEHVSWAGITLPIDDPWWDSHFPPNGYGCKCRLRQISKREYQRLVDTGRYLTTAPPPESTDWVNKRTGEVQQVPKGIDPGWDNNPGKLGRPKSAAKILNEKQQRFKEAIKQPLPAPAHLWSTKGNHVLSTAKGVNQKGIEDVLKRVPGIAPQISKLSDYMAAHPAKAIFVKAEEMGRGKKALALINEVGEFLGKDFRYHPIQAYTTKNINSTGGFTHPAFEHVVVKVKKSDKLSAVDPNQLPTLVDKAINIHNGGSVTWAMPYALVNDGVNVVIPAWAHELGHQVHYWAGSPNKPAAAKVLTKYAAVNDAEWHAEHFVAWLFNRPALAEWDQSIANYLDDLIDTATISQKKRQP